MGGPGGAAAMPAGQQYCLKWNNHQNNLLRVFSRLLGQEQFTDVVVAAEGRHVKCHKMVLSACSSYFEQLFTNFNEPHQVVILKDTSFCDIVAIIEFMYKGEINVSQDKLSSLLKTAENLKVKGLAEVSGEESKMMGTASAIPRGSTTTTHQLHGLPPRLSGPPPMQMLGRPSLNPLGHDPLTLNGEVKRKRGRPRTLDGPQDDNACFGPRITSVQGSGGPISSSSILSQSLSSSSHSSYSGSSHLQGGGNGGAQLALGYVSSSPKLTKPPQPMSPLQQALNRNNVYNSSNDNGHDSWDNYHGTRPLETKVATPSPPVSAPGTPPLSTTPIKTEQGSPGPGTPGGGSGGQFRPPSTPTLPSSLANQPTREQPNSVSQEPAQANTGGGPGNQPFVSSLTPEQVASWGIIKMNDYLVSGTRQQYWEEFFVKHVMSAVKNKEIDMKGAAELLGVSYGTLYGRYRETFGYLKHAWNVTGRPQKKTSLWTDPNTRQILESMRSGAINIKQAAEALGMEPAMLAYQLAGKAHMAHGTMKILNHNGMEMMEEEDPGSYDGEDAIEYNEEMMEVQPDIILEGEPEEVEQFDSIVEEEGVDPISSYATQS